MIGLQFFIARPAPAAISVYPVLLELSVSKEGQLQGSLSVTNEGAEAAEIEVQPEYWLKSSPVINGQAIEIGSWLNLEPKNFRLKPAEKKEVKYSIRAPSGLAGEIMAQVYFADVTKKESAAVNVISRVGVGLYVSVKETQKISAKIDRINITKEGKEIKFEVVVENLGNVHLRPKGKLVIQDSQNRTIKELETQYGWPVFPATKYSYHALCKDTDIGKGQYGVQASIYYGNLYEQKADRTDEKKAGFNIDKDGRIKIK